MTENPLITRLETKLNTKFHQATNPRNIFFDIQEKEATYSTDNNGQIIALKIKGYDLISVPEEIKEMKNLVILSLSFNKIKDISLVSTLLKLTALNLSSNLIENISPLKSIKNLKWLNLQFNLIYSIEPLKLLTEITKLFLSDNKITDISAISNHNKLTELYLANNEIKDIKSIAKIESLKKIDLSNNQITKISAITNLTNIEEINLSKNRIKKVDNLKQLQHLVVLNISFNIIENFAGFKEYRFLIDATGNPFSDIYVFNEPSKGVLNVDWLADVSANIIDQIISEKGSMFGIFGKWGRGKSFFWSKLKEKMIAKKYDVVEFLAWKYHDTPASWAYLYDAFAKVFYKKPEQIFSLRWISYLFKIIVVNFIRQPLTNILRFIFSIFIPILLFFFVKENPNLFFGEWEFLEKVKFNFQTYSYGIIITYFLVITYYFSKVYKFDVRSIFQKFSTKNFESLLGMQAEIEKELIFLTKLWNSKIILFVDDLDRCNEDKILTVIDSLRIMTENNLIAKKIIVVAAIDERILKRVIRNKYQKMVDDKNILDNLTREYLDKLFLFGVKLSKLNNEEKNEIFNNYTSNLQVLFGVAEQAKFDTYKRDPIVEITDFEFIRFYLSKVNDITPRQIRIIYNKLILAKEILKLKLNVINLNQYQSEILVAVIIYFSVILNIENLSNFITESDKKDGELMKKIFDKEFILKYNEWLLFVDAVQMVVPY